VIVLRRSVVLADVRVSSSKSAIVKTGMVSTNTLITGAAVGGGLGAIAGYFMSGGLGTVTWGLLGAVVGAIVVEKTS